MYYTPPLETVLTLLKFRSLPEMEGLSKETVFSSWMAKFDCILKGSLSKLYLGFGYTGIPISHLLFTVGLGDEDKRPSRMQQLNSELILSKEQLYDMFQQILGVKKFEHQLLFNALIVSESLHSVCGNYN